MAKAKVTAMATVKVTAGGGIGDDTAIVATATAKLVMVQVLRRRKSQLGKESQLPRNTMV